MILAKKIKAWRRLASDRGSAYLEYAIVATVVVLVAAMAFRPGSAVSETFGADFAAREILLKLPIF